MMKTTDPEHDVESLDDTASDQSGTQELGTVADASQVADAESSVQDVPEEDPQNYSDAKARLDEIVKQVRAKDVSLERSLDLLEEGVKLANQCTEMIDQTRWEEASEDDEEADAADDTAGNDDPDTASVELEQDPSDPTDEA